MGSYKTERRKGTIGAMVGDAYSALVELRDEMSETVENMEGNNMGHLPKCETAQQAMDDLDQCDVDNDPDVPDSLASVEVEYSEQVQRRKGRGCSRSVRCDNATSMLQAVRDKLQEKEYEENEEARELIEIIDDACDVCPEFPGMYG